MSADAKRQRSLLYVVDFAVNQVDVFTYPRGKQVGTLTGFNQPISLCSDKAGDVFVVQQTGTVIVYAHGGSTPIRQISTSGEPEGCSIDPTTGNLAVTNMSESYHAVITIYGNASGTGAVYQNSQIAETFFCAYDNKGNLFIDGWTKRGEFVLLRLLSGNKRFGMTQLHNFENLGGVEWDGRDVAIGDEGAGLVYRVDPQTEQVVQTVHLETSVNLYQFWNQRDTIIGPDYESFGDVPLWKYPAGGSPTKTLTGFNYPTGATVSIAP